MPRRRPFRSPCTGASGRKPRRGQSSFRRGVLREVRQVGSRICRILQQYHRSSWSRGRNDAHETPARPTGPGMPRRRPFRSPCTGPSGRKPRRGQSSFRRGVLRRRSDRWDPESAEFCSRSPILMVARTKRNDAHETAPAHPTGPGMPRRRPFRSPCTGASSIICGNLRFGLSTGVQYSRY